jgi:hypothetical protein
VLTSHLTPNPPTTFFLQPLVQQTSPLSFLALNLSASLTFSSFPSPSSISLFLSRQTSPPMWRSIVAFRSPPGGVPTGKVQIGHGMGVRSGGGEEQAWPVREVREEKGEWWVVQKARWQPGHW